MIAFPAPDRNTPFSSGHAKPLTAMRTFKDLILLTPGEIPFTVLKPSSDFHLSGEIPLILRRPLRNIAGKHAKIHISHQRQRRQIEATSYRKRKNHQHKGTHHQYLTETIAPVTSPHKTLYFFSHFYLHAEAVLLRRPRAKFQIWFCDLEFVAPAQTRS